VIFLFPALGESAVCVVVVEGEVVVGGVDELLLEESEPMYTITRGGW